MTPLTQSLANLARKRQLTRSVASVVRAELGAILAARQAGLNYEQICMGLRELGLEVSARTLRHTVYRIQAEKPADTATGVTTGTVADLYLPFGPAEAPAPTRSATPASPSSFSIPLVEPFRPSREAQPARPQAVNLGTDAWAEPAATAEARLRGNRFEPDLIRQIQNSTPDLDALADRHRRKLAAERAAQRTSAAAAAARSVPSSPGTATPETTPPHADQPAP
jgi:hypothetical protein